MKIKPDPLVRIEFQIFWKKIERLSVKHNN